MHLELPFERLVEELQPERSLSHNPLFQVMFTFNDVPTANLKLPNLTATLAEGMSNGTAKFDLSLGVLSHSGEGNGANPQTDGGINLVCEYNTDLYDEATVSRLMEHYRRLLRSAAENPGQRVAELSLLSEEERQQLVSEFNETESEYERER